MLGFYVNRPDLAAVLPSVEIGAGTIVRVIEPQACRIWCERNPAFPVGGNKGRTFLGGAVHVDRNFLTMPMQLFRRIRIVVNVDCDPAAPLEAKQRPGKLAIVHGGRHDSFGRDFDGRGLNVQRVVCVFLVLQAGAVARAKTKIWQRKIGTRKSYTCKRARTCEQLPAEDPRPIHRSLQFKSFGR